MIEEAKAEGRNQDSVRLILKKCNFSESTIDSLLQLVNGVS